MIRNSINLFAALALFVSCNAQPKQVSLPVNKDNNSLLWEISGKGLKQKSYLFGTFHLMCRSDIQFSSQLKTAVTNANEIYMELDMDDPAVMLGGMLMMNMKDGKKLKDLYTPAEYEKVSSFFRDSLHTPLNFLEGIKPYFLVAMMYPKMMPCKSVSGVEEELMKLAKQSKKDIKGLETLEFQAAVFDTIPYEQQAKELLKSIDSLATYTVYFDSMVQVYKSQQLDKMEKLFNDEEFGMDEYQDILLDNRNKNWVNQLKTIMKKESVFVAVGAGHLVGEKGLIALLKKEGYTLKPVLNK
jgi:uncharacterized protein YbaP (TraB family)